MNQSQPLVFLLFLYVNQWFSKSYGISVELIFFLFWQLSFIYAFFNLKTTAVILPSLQRLHGDSSELEKSHNLEMVVRKRYDDKKKLFDPDSEREDECGICLEPCTKMVLPNCCHAMCINCYRDW